MSSTLPLSAAELVEQFKSRKLKVKSVVSDIFGHIKASEPKLNSFTALTEELAYQAADKMDAAYDKGDALPSPLAGVPISIKDNINIRGQKTTCCSAMLKDFVAPFDATVTQKVLAAGMVPVGKTNLDEFAMGSSTETSIFGTSRNPWDLARVPGGSSGGAAASVAAHQAFLALGSDTGGSIRQPAAYCGIVGIKPTYGRVSRFGLVAFASSLDQIGPLTKTVKDAALLLETICGHDVQDSTSADMPVPQFSAALGQDIKGMKIAIPKELSGDAISAPIAESLENAITFYKSQGAIVEWVSIESLKYAVPTYYIIAPAEASANLARFDGVRYGNRDRSSATLQAMIADSRGKGFGDEVKRRIVIGTYVLSSGYYDAYYLKAQKVRQLIKKDFMNLFQTYSAILMPTTPHPAFKVGEKINDPWSMYLEDISTIPANMAGLPALSVPSGVTNGLPIGLQIIGKPFDEATVLNLGHHLETQFNFHHRIPTGIQDLLK